MPLPRLLLVGGGHAHVRVLESIARGGWPPALITLLSPSPRELYTGMVPGFLHGRYALPELTVDLARLCDAAGVRWLPGRAERVDSAGKRVIGDRDELPFDLLSLDIGSVPAGRDLPGVAEHALTVRPLRRAEELRGRVEALAGKGRSARIVVVGGGAGGVEVAFAVHRRLADLGVEPLVKLIDGGDGPPEGYPAAARRKVARLLARRGISVIGALVTEVDASGVITEIGVRHDADLVIWVTGAEPSPLARASDLPLSARGYFAVDPSLRSAGGAAVWAAGDCADIEGHELPRAGVYAVRQGAVLAANLHTALSGGTPREYRPQSGFLSLLNTADGRALLRWRDVATHGRAAWWLKDRIDRRWVERFRV